MKKIVIEVHMKNDKYRSKALQIAAAFQGVNSVSLEGASRDQVAVTGDRIDSVCLTNKLRKKFSHATIVSVGDVKDESGGDAGSGAKENETENISVPYWYANYPPQPFHVVYDPCPSSWSIL